MIRYLRSGEGLTLAALVLLSASLFVLPLGLLFQVAFRNADGIVSLRPMIDALQSRSVLRALWNSLESGLLSAVLALIYGVTTALIIGLTDVRRKGLYTFLLLIPMMIPPHVTAIAWIQAMGPSSPLLRSIGLAPELGSTHPLYSREGIVALLGIQHGPLVFLVILAALRALPREMAEAARVSGARPCALLGRIILPLLAPTLIAGFALAFVSALGNFGIPALLGIPARYTTLPVLMWQRLASFGPSVLTDVAVIAALLAAVAVAVAVIALQMRLSQRHRNALIGPPQPALSIALGRARPWVEAGLALIILITLVLTVTALFATALVRTYGLPLTWETLTFSNFDEILFRQSVTARAFANSTLTAGAAALMIALCCLPLARFLAAPHAVPRRIGKGLAALAEMTYAIPSLVISIAFILAFINPLPLIGVSLYGTLIIIFLAYFCAFFAVALKPIGAAYLQLDPALDEAARVAGAGFGLRLRRIATPLMAPAAASGAILVFLTTYNEITVSTLLWSSGSETIGTTIFNYEDGGYTTLAAAMSAVTVLATVALMGALDFVGRKAAPGVIPWRL